MSIPQTPPGGGGQRKHTHWHYVSTEAGKTWNAWMAGRTHWYTCHTKGKSKVCADAMTGGQVRCKLCSPMNVAEVIGYVPLYREIDGRPTVVIVHEYSREQVDLLRMHQCVLVGRGIESSDGVWVAAHPKGGAKYTSTLKERNTPADMTETILKFWGNEEFTAWYRCQNPGSDKPVSLPAEPAIRDDGKPFSDMMQGPAKRWATPAVTEPTAVGDLVDVQREQLARLVKAKPSSNGHHKPKG